MDKEIKYGLDRLVKSGLGKNWSEYWQNEYQRRTPLLKRHFMLEQFASYFLTREEFFKEREKIERKFTKDEWSFLINNACVIQGKIEYSRRMRLYLSHPAPNDIKKN